MRQVFHIWALASLLLPVSGCATIPKAPPTPAEQFITYETEPPPFCGRCDTIKIVASSDGFVRTERGHWAGSYQDWRIKRQTLQVTPEQFTRFREVLAPFRPERELLLDDRLPCMTFDPDQGGVSVLWHGAGGDARLTFNRGCEWGARTALVQALEAAPSILGLKTPDW